MQKKILAVLLALCMALTLAPTTVFAEGKTCAIQLGTKGIAVGNEVYFGECNYYNLGVYYDVPWLVLNTDGFLLSECILGFSQFRLNDGKGGLYKGGALQERMNDLYNGKITLFTDKERGAIKETLLKGESMFCTAPDLNAYLFPLSYNEALKIGWCSDILKACGISGYPDGITNGWWLRTSWSGGNAYRIEESGGPDFYDFYFNYNYDGVRPAFNMDMTSVLLTSAAVGGKLSGAEGADALVSNSVTGVSKWKLTLKDDSRSGFDILTTGFNPGHAFVGYINAKTGQNEYISAIIMDGSDNVLYYGRIKSLPNAGDANGSVIINIPPDVTLGDNVKLKVFNEQYNGNKKTDYSSELVNVPFIPYNSANSSDAWISTKARAFGIAEAATSANGFNGMRLKMPAPDKPVGLKASVLQGCVGLNWNPVAGAAGYEIQYSSAIIGVFQTAGVSKTEDYTFSMLKKGETFFRIRAYSMVNGWKVYGAWSEIISAGPN